MKVENKKQLKEIVLSILFVAGDGLDKDFILQKLEIILSLRIKSNFAQIQSLQII